MTDVGGDAEGNPLTLLMGMHVGTATLKKSMEVPQNIKNRATLWYSNCTTRYLTKDYKNTNLKGYMHPDVYSSILNNIQIMERAQLSINWWMDKEDVVCVCVCVCV